MPGSTSITRQLDPEEVMDIMDTSLKRLAEPVETHRRRVTRFQGDGFSATGAGEKHCATALGTFMALPGEAERAR